jgi:hypothetical protein
MWLVGLSSIHKYLYSHREIVIGVITLLIYQIFTQIVVCDNAIFHLFITTLSNYLLKLIITILFSISPRSNSNLNKLLH